MAEAIRGRPRMPAGYGIEHSTDEGMLPWSHVSHRMGGSRNYWVGTTRPDGRPHVAPVWGVWIEETFYFATDRVSRKGRNLATSPEVVVHLESGDDVVVLEGTVEEASDAALRARFADAYEAKYQFRPGVDEAALIHRVRPRVVLAWLEQDFPRTATRWIFGDD